MPRTTLRPLKVRKEWKESRDLNPFAQDVSLKDFLKMKGVHPSDLNRAVELCRGKRDFTVWLAA